MIRRRVTLGGDHGAQEQWHQFDVKVMMTRLTQQHDPVYGIQVEASDAHGRPVGVVQPRNAEEEGFVSPAVSSMLRQRAILVYY